MMDQKGSGSILDLDIYLLNKIYGYFYFEKDKLNLAKVHPHLSEAYVFHNPSKYKDLDFYFHEDPFIFEWFGAHITCLRDESIYNDSVHKSSKMLELAGQLCPNLEVLDFLVSGENLNIIVPNLKKLITLNYVIIRSRDYHANLHPLLNMLKDLPKLTRMAIYHGFENLTPLNDLEQLSDLRIDYIEDSQIHILKKMWLNLPSLRTYADLKTLGILSKYCANLEFLKVRLYTYSEDCFPHFPKLKRLKIFSSYDNDMCIRSLHGNYNNQLEILEFPHMRIYSGKSARRFTRLKSLKTFYCRAIGLKAVRYFTRLPLENLIVGDLDNECLLIVISECKTLRFIQTDRFVCDSMFLNSFLDILKERGFTEENPFELNLYGREFQIAELNSRVSRRILKFTKSRRYLSLRYSNMRN